MRPFADRRAAGIALAEALRRRGLEGSPLVLGLPRGGVPVAFEVAQALEAPLDVMVVRKVGMPGHEELALGAVAAGGIVVRDASTASIAGLDAEAFAALAATQRREMERREAYYRARRPAPDLRDRVVVLVDDGIATGSTMRAAIRAARLAGAATVVVAAPVAASDALARIEQEADESVVLHAPREFAAVGAWYYDFGQTTDAEVLELLSRAAQRGVAP